MKRLMAFGLSLALTALMSVSFAQDHGHEEDIHLGVSEGRPAVIEPHELADPPYLLELSMEELIPGLFGIDQGWDFYTEDGEDHPQLRRVTVLQTFISDGLFGTVEGEVDPIFGSGLPGVWTLEWDENDPEAVHQHIIFASNILPSENNPLFFKFRLVDAIAWDGTALPDSDIEYTLQFVPEPASLTALGVGLGALLLRRRRQTE